MPYKTCFSTTGIVCVSTSLSHSYIDRDSGQTEISNVVFDEPGGVAVKGSITRRVNDLKRRKDKVKVAESPFKWVQQSTKILPRIAIRPRTSSALTHYIFPPSKKAGPCVESGSRHQKGCSTRGGIADQDQTVKGGAVHVNEERIIGCYSRIRKLVSIDPIQVCVLFKDRWGPI